MRTANCWWVHTPSSPPLDWPAVCLRDCLRWQPQWPTVGADFTPELSDYLGEQLPRVALGKMKATSRGGVLAAVQQKRAR